ncbi:MAG: LuxR C-terminal-related transcriptional regulator [Prevotella sp.]
MKNYKIIIVDDHPIVREGIKSVLSQLQGVTCLECNSPKQLQSLLDAKIHLDLCILDMEYPDSDAVAIFDLVSRISSCVPVLIYSIHEEPWILSKLSQNNICGYVPKSSPLDNLVRAVLTIRDGGKWYAEVMQTAANSKHSSSSDAEELLTDREKQVLYYMSKGYGTSEIAQMLHISVLTAKKHRGNLAKKLNARNSIEIVMKGKIYL